MPEIKFKHVVSFSSEDKVHKAENLMKSETYRKWKCATPGEKQASVVLQFEKATQIHSIDVGNESSAFVEILVGRSSDASSDYQVLLVASSFMSPMESRNGSNTNRVRMFTEDKLSQTLKRDKWDCVKIVCTQPFNKTIQYGLSFIKFHSPPDPSEQSDEKVNSKESGLNLGAFKFKKDEEESDIPVGNWFSKRNELQNTPSVTGPAAIRQASSFAAAVLASSSDLGLSKTPSRPPLQISNSKRKYDTDDKESPASSKHRASPILQQAKKEKHDYKKDYSVPMESKHDKGRKRDHPKILKQSASQKELSKERSAKQKPLNRVMDKVVFVLSGFQNPERSDLRDRAMEMGAKYKGDWDGTCTHLICAFLNTPKYNHVRSKGGRVVNRDWIHDCYKKKQLLPWRKYMLGKYTKDSTTEEESEEEIKDESKNENPKLSAQPRSNGSLEKNDIKESGAGNNSEEDYLAPTDIDSDSDGDTEDELRKAREKMTPTKANKQDPVDSESSVSSKHILSTTVKEEESDTENEDTDFDQKQPTKPDTKDLPLPELPNFFKNKHFLLYGQFSTKDRHNIQRCIIGYNGCLEPYMNEKVKYVITQSKWDENFDDALSENENLTFVRPHWIYKCSDLGKLVPYQPYIIVPEA